MADKAKQTEPIRWRIRGEAVYGDGGGVAELTATSDRWDRLPDLDSALRKWDERAAWTHIAEVSRIDP
jgi:hypothetical protein